MSEHRRPHPKDRPLPRRYNATDGEEWLMMFRFERRVREQMRHLALIDWMEIQGGAEVEELNWIVLHTFDCFEMLWKGLGEPQWLIDELAPTWAKLRPLIRSNYERASAQLERRVRE